MTLDFTALNWAAIGASVVAGQLISTVWFVVLFAKPWAQEYGVASAKEHTSQIPPWTYPIQILCTVALTVSLALFHQIAGVQSVADALAVAGFVIVGFSLSTGLPGQAFLKRWRVAAIAYGSQAAMIVGISLLLGLWR